jgi:non-ribosomal peptide synthetase component F
MTADLKRLSHDAGVTLYMTLLAAFATLLHHYSSQPQLLIGSPVANRMLDNFDRVIGLFANMLVMRMNLDDNPRFSQLLERVRNLALAAYAHQDLPFEVLVEHLNPVRDGSRNPLVQVVFTMLEATDLQPSLSGLKVSPLPVDLGTSKFDLYLEMVEQESCLNGRLVFDSALFSRATARTIDEDFVKLLALILRNKEARVRELLQMNEERRESSSQIMGARDLEGTFLL